ncbi:MAG: hypothetical protein J7M10_00455 [Candidatus Cloacimonetes bacterium]|nr:hypothetical protein [Candidatus Cloacimonadota bacterium]
MKKHPAIKVVFIIMIVIIIVAIAILSINFYPKTNKNLTQNTAIMIDRVKTSLVPLVKRYPARYDLLAEVAEKGFNNTQNYALPNFLGQDYFKGYSDMNTYKSLTFPRDHKAQLDFQFGWYFWSGNFLDENNNVVDLVVVFFRRALYPPPIASELGISDIENQLVQTVVAVNYADKNLHVTGSNPIVSGTSGKIVYEIEPFLARVGENSAQSMQKDKMFPMKIVIDDPEKELKIYLNLTESKPILLQGDEGKVPSIFGLGTWYYSYPNIKTTGSVTYQGETINLKGKMWMDHQWMSGISPTGYPKNLAVQALATIISGFNRKTPKSFGWDWSDVQFDDNTEITFASAHSDRTEELQNMGENPPADVTRVVSGKYIDENGNSEVITGSVTINNWMRSPRSHAWYPNGWEVKIPDKNLEFTMTSTVDDQFIYSVSSEIREGGTIVKGTKDGKEISGYGFGEGVNYSGLEFPLKANMALLGIQDNAENRMLLQASPPSAWLVIQSIIVLVAFLTLFISIILIIIILIKKRHIQKV